MSVTSDILPSSSMVRDSSSHRQLKFAICLRSSIEMRVPSPPDIPDTGRFSPDASVTIRLPLSDPSLHSIPIVERCLFTPFKSSSIVRSQMYLLKFASARDTSCLTQTNTGAICSSWSSAFSSWSDSDICCLISCESLPASLVRVAVSRFFSANSLVTWLARSFTSISLRRLGSSISSFFLSSSYAARSFLSVSLSFDII